MSRPAQGTLRDYFAAKDLQALIPTTSSSGLSRDERLAVRESLAREAYDWADAMEEARRPFPDPDHPF